jgi:pSer/pThr/pTyr-binding forkhead associated (FHA) protein
MAGSEPQRRTGQGSGMPLDAFRPDALNLSRVDFEQKHASAFLLLTAAELRVPKGPATTEVKVSGLDEPASERTASLSLLAYPVVRTERSVGHLVTVGRTSNNDVVIPDLSISRFHAFLKPAADGRFQVQDANSTNGTTVNGSSVPAQGHGSAVELKSGDNVRLGQVELTFLSAEALREFVLAREA